MAKMVKKSFLTEGRYGPLLKPVIRRLFSAVSLPEEYAETVSEFGRKGHLVFALARTSIVDSLLLIEKNRSEGLPVPRMVFGKSFPLFQPAWKLPGILMNMVSSNNPVKSGFLKEYIESEGSASLVFLDRARLRGGFDPVLELLRLQAEISKPVYLIPLRLIYTRSPLKIKDASKEEEASLRGFGKIFTLLRASEKGFVEHGSPLSLQEYTRRTSDDRFIGDTAEEIRNALRQTIAQLGRNISGAPIKKKEWIIQTSLNDPMLAELIGTRDNPKNPADFMQAERYLEQIAADMNPAYIKVFEKVMIWVFKNIYSGISLDEESLKKVRDSARKGPIVYMPCHKSHMDYIILSYILYQNWMSIPFIASGANLSFFPLGRIFRKSGAFFMKRTFKGNRLYSQTFASYIRTLLSEKIPIEFFIEGTRSRSGKLALPKTGLLSMIVDAWKQGGMRKDILFVPVYIGYDLVVEEDAYAMELKGGKKESENLSQLVKAARLLFRRYGKVYVRFSDPVSIRDYIKSDDEIQKSGMDTSVITNRLAWEIIAQINRKTVVTAPSVFASVVMSRKGAMDEVEAMRLFRVFTDYLVHMKSGMSDSFRDISKAFSESALLFEGRGLVNIEKTEDEPVIYEADSNSRIHLSYYKNTVINCLAPAAIISNIILKLSGIPRKSLEDEYGRIRALFSKEFSIEDRAFDAALDYLIEKKMLRRSWGSISYDREAHDVLSSFSGLITDYLESYLVVAKSIKKLSGTKDIVKALESKAEIMLKKDEIERPEALCVPNFKGALEFLRSSNIIDKGNKVISEKDLDRLSEEIASYLEK